MGAVSPQAAGDAATTAKIQPRLPSTHDNLSATVGGGLAAAAAAEVSAEEEILCASFDKILRLPAPTAQDSDGQDGGGEPPPSASSAARTSGATLGVTSSDERGGGGRRRSSRSGAAAPTGTKRSKSEPRSSRKASTAAPPAITTPQQRPPAAQHRYALRSLVAPVINTTVGDGPEPPDSGLRSRVRNPLPSSSAAAGEQSVEW